MGIESFAKTPNPPYYAVIFTSARTPADNGYEDMAYRMIELVSRQPGFLGVESSRGHNGFGITVSYWASLEDIEAWKAHAEHMVAQEYGKKHWYERYEVRVASVERAYSKPCG